MRVAGNYHIDKIASETGTHVLHLNGCAHQPSLENRLQLGYHLDCKSAIITANNTHSSVVGCKYCSIECNQ